MAEEMIEEKEKKGFLQRLRSIFGGNKDAEEGEEEAPQYKRRLLDGRIEKYLDQNFNGYIQEYGILTGLDLEGYEMRYTNLTSRITAMKDYMIDADAHVASMEKEIAEVQTASKKK